MMTTCSECNSARLEGATLTGATLKPERANDLVKNFTAASLRVRVCLDCGKVADLRADATHLRKMLGES